MNLLQPLRDLGLLGPLDVRFAAAMGRLGDTDDADVALGAALASRALSVGDVGVALDRIHASLSMACDDDVPAFPDEAAWRTALASASAIVRGPNEARPAPLVLNGSDLYLERTWAYQQRLAATVQRRLQTPPRPVDLPRLEALLTRLQFDDPRTALQQRAVITAVMRGLSLIAGGPGTGKTAVVVKLLAALQQLELERTGRPLRVKLAAPTGKAAARMSESIQHRAAQWVPDDLRAAVQTVEASTIHRLLGGSGRPSFRHHADNPLPVDLLVVDEASMIDLPLMTKLLEAVPHEARVLLLGDPDQLASVEVGAVFADLCRATSRPVVAPLRMPQPGEALTVLTHTWRYAAGSGIEALAEAVNAGEAGVAVDVLQGPAWPDVTLLDVPSGEVARTLEDLVVPDCLRVARAASPLEALRAMRRVRVLGPHRAGALGVTALNTHLQARVRDALAVAPSTDTYAGRPVMITRNDHDLRLYNGDVGVAFAEGPEEASQLRIWFETADGAGRAVAAAVLPEHDTVFATTVHKSQGSEYEHVVLVLPTRASPMLTRELLYTAVTRATSRVTILGSATVLQAAIERSTERMSRLAGLLKPPDEEPVQDDLG